MRYTQCPQDRGGGVVGTDSSGSNPDREQISQADDDRVECGLQGPIAESPNSCQRDPITLIIQDGLGECDDDGTKIR